MITTLKARKYMLEKFNTGSTIEFYNALKDFASALLYMDVNSQVRRTWFTVTNLDNVSLELHGYTINRGSTANSALYSKAEDVILDIKKEVIAIEEHDKSLCSHTDEEIIALLNSMKPDTAEGAAVLRYVSAMSEYDADGTTTVGLTNKMFDTLDLFIRGEKLSKEVEGCLDETGHHSIKLLCKTEDKMQKYNAGVELSSKILMALEERGFTFDDWRESFNNSRLKLCYIEGTFAHRRVATKEEVDRRPANMYYKLVEKMNPTVAMAIALTTLWFKPDKPELNEIRFIQTSCSTELCDVYRQLNVGYDPVQFVYGNLTMIVDMLSKVLTHIDEIIDALQKCNNSFDGVTENFDVSILPETESTTEMCECITSSKLKTSAIEYSALAVSICKDLLSKPENEQVLSEKQWYIVRKMYSAIKAGKETVNAANVNSKGATELVTRAKEIMKLSQNKSTKKFMTSVIDYYTKYGKMSEKQFNALEKSVKQLESEVEQAKMLEMAPQSQSTAGEQKPIASVTDIIPKPIVMQTNNMADLEEQLFGTSSK